MSKMCKTKLAKAVLATTASYAVFLSNPCVASASSEPVAQDATVSHVVRVGKNRSDIRVLPEDAGSWGLHYGTLDDREAQIVASFWADLTVAKRKGLSQVDGFKSVIFSRGDFPKKDGSPGTMQDAELPVNAASGNFEQCHITDGASLGADKGNEYALLSVACPTAPLAYRTILFGMTLRDGKVVDFVANVGDLAPLVHTQRGAVKPNAQ